jgi:hypothetical protein
VLYDGAGEALRDAETTIHSLATFSQLASIEGATQRAPEGQPDDRAVAFVLALAGRARLLREGRYDADYAEPILLTPGCEPRF